jgi:hypothetical protein
LWWPLTVLRAGIAGERIGLSPFGSFDKWSYRIREPLVWLRQIDPCETLIDVRKAIRSGMRDRRADAVGTASGDKSSVYSPGRDRAGDKRTNFIYSPDKRGRVVQRQSSQQ